MQSVKENDTRRHVAFFSIMCKMEKLRSVCSKGGRGRRERRGGEGEMVDGGKGEKKLEREG